MSLRLLDPQNINDLIIINDCIGFKQTKRNIILFQLLCLAVLIIKEFKDRTISWLSHDIHLFQFDALGGLALGLIAWLTTSLVAICRKFIDKKALQIIFCLVFTFNHIPNKLFHNLKNLMHIKKKAFSNFLTLARIKLYNYNLDSNLQNIKDENTIVPPLFLFSNTRYLLAFVQSACDINEQSCQFFSTLLMYQACTKDSQDKL